MRNVSVFLSHFQRFVECSKRSVCANELLMLEHSDVRLLQQKRAAKALVTALDNCSEAVDITSEDPRQFQVGFFLQRQN